MATLTSKSGTRLGKNDPDVDGSGRITGGGARTNPTIQTDPAPIGFIPMDDSFVLAYWWDPSGYGGQGEWVPVTRGMVPGSVPYSQAYNWIRDNFGGIVRRDRPTSNPTSGALTEAYPGQETTAGGGGGGRAAAAAPVYIAPNEGSVREQVKAYVVATTGTADKQIIDSAVKVFMDENKRAFDVRESQELDPWLAMQNHVRGTAQYKAIHQIRPESVDEMDWVTSRQAKLRQLGVSSQRSETLGIAQATVDANDEALVNAGEMAQVADTGRLLQSQRESLKQSANAVLGLI